MTAGSLQLIAPAFHVSTHSEAEVFGSAVWLWMHTSDHRDLPLKALTQLLLPPLKNRQYVLASADDGRDVRPVAYVAWAMLSAEAESRYLDNPAVGLRVDDWASGDRMWFVDWFAPFGHSDAFGRVVRRLMPDVRARSLDHRGNERGMRVVTHRGRNVTAEQSRLWWQARPMLAHIHSPEKDQYQAHQASTS